MKRFTGGANAKPLRRTNRSAVEYFQTQEDKRDKENEEDVENEGDKENEEDKRDEEDNKNEEDKGDEEVGEEAPEPEPAIKRMVEEYQSLKDPEQESFRDLIIKSINNKQPIYISTTHFNDKYVERIFNDKYVERIFNDKMKIYYVNREKITDDGITMYYDGNELPTNLENLGIKTDVNVQEGIEVVSSISPPTLVTPPEVQGNATAVEQNGGCKLNKHTK